ncbi:BrnT family toxin [Devosia sp. A8/3-2]|nr:BrnT family toxin [Devosia sp. A8/3-2]
MDFEWDETKNRSNLEKHGVDFSIMHDFDWDRASLRIDDRQDYGEERLMAYGPVGDKLYVIVFTMRAGKYRIISARRFGRKDHQFYEQPKSSS